MTATIGWWAELFSEPTPASLSVTGGTPTVSTTENNFIQPASASLAITGGTPTMGDLVIRPAGASIALAGGTPSVNIGQVLAPAGASLTATGGTPSVIRGNILRPSGASLTVTGGTPTVTVGTPVAFDAVSSGHGLSSCTWSHTASAGAYVIVDVVCDRTVTPTVTYNSASMTQIGSVAHNNSSGFSSGMTVRFGIAGVASGAKTVAVTASGAWTLAVAASYANVTSAGTASTAFGTGTSRSQGPITCPSGGRVVQTFGVGNPGSTLASLSGGTNRYNQFGLDGNGCGACLSDSNSTVSFTGTASTSSNWGGIATVLS